MSGGRTDTDTDTGNGNGTGTGTGADELFPVPPEPPVRLLGLGGGTRPGSASFALVRAALATAAELGAETRAADVGVLDLPLLREGCPLADQPPAVAWLLAEARAADALILCSPTYLGTLSGAIKNLLDYLSLLGDDAPPYLAGKPVGLLAYGGANAAHTLTALGHVAHALDALVVPTSVAVAASAVDKETAEITDPKLDRRLRRMVAELIDLGARLRRPAAETHYPARSRPVIPAKGESVPSGPRARTPVIPTKEESALSDS